MGERTASGPDIGEGSPHVKCGYRGVSALCAALAAAIGNVIRQRSAQEVTDKPVLALFGMLLRDSRWVGGLGDIASYCLLAAALDKGSVILVMSLQVTALLFALLTYARFTRHPVTRGEWMWAVLLAVALTLVIAVGQPAGGLERAPSQTWPVVAVVMGPPLLLCLLGAGSGRIVRSLRCCWRRWPVRCWRCSRC